MIALDHVESAIASGLNRNAPLMRIAVVGCGPKGLFCIDQLAEQLERHRSSRPLHVAVYEPADYPGAGLVYDPQQPHYLRMNFAAEHINVWRNPNRGPSLLKWLARRHPNYASTGAFVPRAIVGEYLHDSYQSVIGRLSKYADVVRIKQPVVDVADRDSGWGLITNDGQSVHTYDEVLLAVGHEGWRAADSTSADFDVQHVYPTVRQLSPAAAPAGSRIAMRGIGLTAIDAALALTEGRGGEFLQEGDRWRYQSAGAEPAVIYPYSRSGRPMLAKPVPHLMSVPDLGDLWDEQASSLLSLASVAHPLNFADAIWPVVLAAADAALQAAGVRTVGVNDWFEAQCRDQPRAADFQRQVAGSIAVATGRRPPDAAWALGEAWRRLYPALVKVISHDGLTADTWPRFRAVAGQMERIAFGPPVENCCKLLALIECGLVNLSCLRGRVRTSESGSKMLESDCGGQQERIDLQVNAVLPGPATPNPCGPLATLAAKGRLVTHPSGCGYRIEPSGRPVTAEGQPLPGLTLVGRPTEGAVLGNDTLNPRLHNQPVRWAQQIVSQLECPERSLV